MKPNLSKPRQPLSRLSLFFLSLVFLSFVFSGRLESSPQQPSTADAEFFRHQILPILAKRCGSCHNDTLKLSGLTLDSSAGLQRGGSHGPAVTPGNPEQSRLYRRVARLEKPFMPMEGDPVPDAEIALLKTWITRGAHWPEPPELSGEGNQQETGTASVPREVSQKLSPNERFFNEKVYPLFSARCVDCHNDERKYSGFTMETRTGFFNGGWHGPVVISGKPDESRLYRRVARLEKTYMPMGGSSGSGEPLSQAELAIIRQWIEGGAEWPRDPKLEEAERARAAKKAELQKLENRPVTEEERQWWSFIKPVKPPVPQVKNVARVKNPIDAFVLSALEAKGLRPAPQASRRTLIRRAYMDLVGLPPSPEAVQTFANDPSPNAYEKLVDHLLDSERYGERWARRWLDVARYADSDGYEYDRIRPNAWRYRDYVIRAFNEDKPYNRFILEQLAGDELPDRNYESLVALGFCRNGPFIGDMVLMQNEMTRQDELDDIVSTTSAAFLGVTLGCARCHNHKYDPLAQKDYYRMVAAFAPSVRTNLPLAPPPIAEKYERQVSEIDRKIDALSQQIRLVQKPVRDILLAAKYKELPEPLQVAIRTEPGKRTEAQRRQAAQVFGSTNIMESEIQAKMSADDLKKIENLKTQITELEQSKPPAVPSAMAITDPTTTPAKSYFLHRGSIISKGSEMAAGPPLVLSSSKQEIVFPNPGPQAKTTGRRLALARWLADEQNPLTARVMVNRIWQGHFGKGIVDTPSDFGHMGSAPSHPELLDWLATEFVRQGWSIKAMHRLMLTSSTYQQTSNFTELQNAKKDPQNYLLWKMPVQRLEGEIIRDSVLAVSGGLSLKAGGPGIFPEVDRGLIEGSPKESAQLFYQRWPVTKDGPELWRRSIYVTQMRTVTAPIMDLFDPPDSVSSCARRNSTTVAPQALQLLNNKFVMGQSALFAERLREEVGKDTLRQVQRAYFLAFGRPPEKKELDASLTFLKEQELYHQGLITRLYEKGVDPAEILSPERSALVDLCHSLFNANEFVYIN